MILGYGHLIVLWWVFKTGSELVVTGILFVEHIVPLLQHMLVFLGLAYLFTKTPVFASLINNTLSWPDKLVVYLVFSGFCILGTFLSEQSFQSAEAITNTRAIGAVLGGLLGGPVVGLLVGATGGIHRLFSLSSASDPIHYIDIACAIATMAGGLLAGYTQWLYSRRGQIERIFSAPVVFGVALLAESGHMLIIVLFGWWFEDNGLALRLVMEIAPPMIIANTLGAVLVMYTIREQKHASDELYSRRHAWAIAKQASAMLHDGFTAETSQQIAKSIQQETRVAAVAITDRQHLLAFTGIGADHHLAGSLITSATTQQAIDENRIIFSDGITHSYHCHLEPACSLGSVLIIPLRDEANNEVLGTIKLYEEKHQLFRNINRKLGEDIAQLLSVNILAWRYQRQQQLRIQDQYHLLTTQVNPHFLYNALTTIGHITTQHSERAKALLQHLANFFRRNLEHVANTCSLREELTYLQAYLEIEKARFESRLRVSIDIPEQLLDYTVPVFTLQPVVENAIKHGIAELIDGGHVKISAQQNDDTYTLCVEDNAGLYTEQHQAGYGLKIDERIKISCGDAFGLSIRCEPNQWTKVSILLPKKVQL